VVIAGTANIPGPGDSTEGEPVDFSSVVGLCVAGRAEDVFIAAKTLKSI